MVRKLVLLAVLACGCQTTTTTLSVEGGMKEVPRNKYNRNQTTSYRPDINARAEITFGR